jgi:hypothetical protein
MESERKIRRRLTPAEKAAREEFLDHYDEMAALSRARFEQANPAFTYLGVRLPLRLKAELEAAAARLGRSLSAEVVERLQVSMRSQQVFSQTLKFLFTHNDTPVSVEAIATAIRAYLERGEGGDAHIEVTNTASATEKKP